MDKESSNEKYYELYLIWVRSLRCSVSYDMDLHSLRNCVNFSEILHRIDDEYFTEEWVNTFANYDTDSSWRVKAGNLRKLLKKLTEYLELHTGRTIAHNSFWVIDEQLLCEEGDVQQVVKVFNLIMVTALLGQNKMEFVNLAMEQSPDVQQLTMTAVTNFTQNSKESNDLSQDEDNFEVSNGNSFISNEVDRVNVLARENEELRANNAKLESELEKVHADLLHLSSAPSIDKLEKEKSELKKRKEVMEERAMDLEAKLESLNNNLELKETELETLREKVDKIHVFEDDYTRMRDEIEELRARDLENKKISKDFENLKQRNKEALNDKNELNVLREKSARYMEDMIALEDEKSKNKTLRQQIGALKAQKEEKEGELEKLTIRMGKLEFELGEAKSKLMASEKKNEDHVHEKLQFQDKIAELQLKYRAEDSLHSNLGTSMIDSEAEESRSRILEQEKEILRLRERVRELEKLEEEQHEWHSTKGKIRELESELQISNTKKAELLGNIEKLENDLETREFSGDVNQLRVEIEKRSIEYDKLLGQLQMHDRRANEAGEAVKKIEDLLAEERKEKHLVEERFKKACQTIKDLEMKMTETDGFSRHEFDSMKSEKEKREKTIRVLENEIKKLNTKHEEETRLMTTSFHSVAQKKVQLQRDGLTDKHSMLTKQNAANAHSYRYC
ncbi:unnamed protein product [Auanema sp. JU1783]|nr:unnamed protein product [Auanema sp. JU1783]